MNSKSKIKEEKLITAHEKPSNSYWRIAQRKEKKEKYEFANNIEKIGKRKLEKGQKNNIFSENKKYFNVQSN